MRLQARSFDQFLFVTGILGEAGIGWQPAGANELNVPDDTPDRLSHEQLMEVVGAIHTAIPEADAPVDAEPSAADPGPGGASKGPSAGALPPRSGAGASRAAWAEAAETRQLTVTADMSRDDIIAMVDQQEAHGGS